MTDLTKIEKPFGFLDNETQQALRNHGGPYERYSEDGDWVGIFPSWLKNSCYRVKTQPLTKPSIDWSHVADKYKWLAIDENKSAYLYIDKPLTHNMRKVWTADKDYIPAVNFASFKQGTCDWKDSLIERPEGV